MSLKLGSIDCQEIRVEKRALFKFDLPNKKSVGVKVKPERTVEDVLCPILFKYGYDINSVIITQVCSNHFYFMLWLFCLIVYWCNI